MQKLTYDNSEGIPPPPNMIARNFSDSEIDLTYSTSPISPHRYRPRSAFSAIPFNSLLETFIEQIEHARLRSKEDRETLRNGLENFSQQPGFEELNLETQEKIHHLASTLLFSSEKNIKKAETELQIIIDSLKARLKDAENLMETYV